MRRKGDIEYEITPVKMDAGERWINVKLKNKGKKAARNINARLNSTDTLGLEVIEASRFVPMLEPGSEHTLFFRVAAYMTTAVYISLDGLQDGDRYYWESADVSVYVGDYPAELINIYAYRKPHVFVGDSIKVEATVRANIDTPQLTLEIWSEDPQGIFDELKIVKAGQLSAGKSEIYTADLKPSKKGIYKVDAILYDGKRRIGKKQDYVLVEEER